MLIPFDFERTLRAIRETLVDLANSREPDPESTPEALAARDGIIDARGGKPWDYADPLPAAFWPRPLYPAMTPNEVIAYDLLERHLFSHSRLEAEGLTADYRALGIPSKVEERWRGEFVNALVERCGRYPECVGTVLSLAAEYPIPGILERLLIALDDAATTYQAPDGALLEQCGPILDALEGSPAEDAEELRSLAADLARRLALRLEEGDPEGTWRETWAALAPRLEERA